MKTRQLVLSASAAIFSPPTDQGATWLPRNSEIKALIMGGVRLRLGVIVLAGQGGNFFVSRDRGADLRPLETRRFRRRRCSSGRSE